MVSSEEMTLGGMNSRVRAEWSRFDEAVFVDMVILVELGSQNYLYVCSWQHQLPSDPVQRTWVRKDDNNLIGSPCSSQITG
jgi:hypothetical protein